VSLDPETKKQLKALADEKHGGNLSALITEMAAAAVQAAAADRLWARSGLPENTPAESAAIRAEWAEAWTLSRPKSKSRKPKKRAARFQLPARRYRVSGDKKAKGPNRQAVRAF